MPSVRHPEARSCDPEVHGRGGFRSVLGKRSPTRCRGDADNGYWRSGAPDYFFYGALAPDGAVQADPRNEKSHRTRLRRDRFSRGVEGRGAKHRASNLGPRRLYRRKTESPWQGDGVQAAENLALRPDASHAPSGQSAALPLFRKYEAAKAYSFEGISTWPQLTDCSTVPAYSLSTSTSLA